MLCVSVCIVIFIAVQSMNLPNARVGDKQRVELQADVFANVFEEIDRTRDESYELAFEPLNVSIRETEKERKRKNASQTLAFALSFRNYV